ncbi:peptidyl-tRNA hydrolase Pth2 [Archaeoglobus profundus]|uniref:Peptidyl-tRNA hydrolase n=1 Tax=Archaeoglobus profundus (strain DSM 5631 / JCM 9629 / NBRC 100127 / Av18) TaxID=572546 RepID=D2RF60_ARCPA|nr:peptidyl-tRNA hydrolase Pth2 [Archaeoglobus profundus]ADB58754.1 Aminoacyl-tRNA hydrolase [Archaeoglobus profundus DSM 5631]
MNEIKQVIVVREDLKLSRGKLAVQVAHASIIGYEKADRRIVEAWKMQGQKKIVLKVNSLEELMKIKEKAEKMGLPTGIVVDAGLTEIPPGTITAVVIGPDEAKKIDKVTGNLPLLK